MFGFLAEGGGATPPPAHNNFGDTMSDGIAGPLALLIILLLAVAMVLLIRSMNKHLRRVPDSFPASGAADRRDTRGERKGGDAPDGGSTGGAAADTVAPTGPAAPAGS